MNIYDLIGFLAGVAFVGIVTFIFSRGQVAHVLRHMIEDGVLRVVVRDAPYKTVPCAACDGSGRVGRISLSQGDEPGKYEGDGDGLREIMAYMKERDQRVCLMAQGVCFACEGSGKKLIRHGGSVSKENQ